MSPAEEVRSLEMSLLSPAVRKDARKIQGLLADEFQEFGASGQVYTKAEVIKLLAEERETRIAMQDFACHPVGESVLLVRYRSVRSADDGVVVEALRSSIWILREGRWQMLFHQGTRVGA